MPDKNMLKVIFIACSVISLIFLILIVWGIARIVRKDKVLKKIKTSRVITFVISAVCVAVVETALYNLPVILLGGTPWAAIDEFGPTGLINTVIAFGVLFVTLFGYFAFCLFFYKPTSDSNIVESRGD